MPHYWGRGLWLDPARLFEEAARREPEEVDLAQVWRRPGYASAERYRAADVSFPLILVRLAPGPPAPELPFRMVDGRHRLAKLRAEGREPRFVVFQEAEVRPFLEPGPWLVAPMWAQHIWAAVLGR